MEETAGRTARIISLEEAETLDVIINLDNANCASSVAFLDAEAASHGLQIRYLLVNSSRTVIPDWALKSNMQIINYMVDYGRKCKLLTGKAEDFAKNGADILLAISNHRSDIIDRIATMSNAALKMGRHSRGKNDPYDVTVRWTLLERDRDLAADLLNNLKVITGEKQD